MLNSLTVSPHGGGCCGLSHWHDFRDLYGRSSESVAEIKKEFHDKVERLLVERQFEDWNGDEVVAVHSHAIQVVLTDGQLEDGWKEILDEAGFQNCFRWFNSNSGNYCNLFMYCPETDHVA